MIYSKRYTASLYLNQWLITLGIVFNVSSIFDSCGPCKFTARQWNTQKPVPLISNEQNQYIQLAIDDLYKPSKRDSFTVTLDLVDEYKEQLSHQEYKVPLVLASRGSYIEVPINLKRTFRIATEAHIEISLARRHLWHPFGCSHKENIVVKLDVDVVLFNAWADIDLEGKVYLHWYGYELEHDRILASKQFNISYYNIPNKIELFCLKPTHDSSNTVLPQQADRCTETFLTIDATKLRSGHNSYMQCKLSTPQTKLDEQFFQGAKDKDFILGLNLQDDKNSYLSCVLRINLLPLLFANTDNKLALEFQDLESLYYQSSILSKQFAWKQVNTQEFLNQLNMLYTKHKALMNHLDPKNLTEFSEAIQAFTKSRFQNIQSQLDTLQYTVQMLQSVDKQKNDQKL